MRLHNDSIYVWQTDAATPFVRNGYRSSRLLKPLEILSGSARHYKRTVSQFEVAVSCSNGYTITGHHTAELIKLE